VRPRLVLLLAAVLLVAGCTASAQSRRVPSRAVTATRSVASGAVPAAATTVRAGPCPFLPISAAASAVGMRLARSQVLLSGGSPTGCRFYALQHSPLHLSEHLPGPKQPVVAITSSRYRSAYAAREALVRLARGGSNPQRARAAGAPGVCYQGTFYLPDRGRDWACAFAHRSTVVLVRTVVTSPAFNVIEVARAVLPRL
jgi:hypothetical protein